MTQKIFTCPTKRQITENQYVILKKMTQKIFCCQKRFWFTKKMLPLQKKSTARSKNFCYDTKNILPKTLEYFKRARKSFFRAKN